jgi:hypothetical protein
MGQYWNLVNLDKKEYVDHYKVGCGAKLWEQLANHPSTGTALIILCAAMPEARGGGDFDLEDNWHGPERTFPEHNGSPGPMPEDYEVIARRTIGRWTGDRIAFVGDYAEDSDLPEEFEASKISGLCATPEEYERYEMADDGIKKEDLYTDISDDVCRVIEHELNGKFVGSGWKDFERNDA